MSEKRFLDLTDREILDLGYDATELPIGLRSIRTDALRGEGWGDIRVMGDSIGTDGSKWKVVYRGHDFNNDLSKGKAELERTATKYLPNGTLSDIIQKRKATVLLRPQEMSTWGFMWGDSSPKEYYSEKTGGRLNYLNFFN